MQCHAKQTNDVLENSRKEAFSTPLIEECVPFFTQAALLIDTDWWPLNYVGYILATSVC